MVSSAWRSVLRSAVALELGGPGLEGGAALVDQGARGCFSMMRSTSSCGCVEAAAVLASVWVKAHVDSAAFEDRLALQEALVYGAELLDGHVAVVDEARPLGCFGVAEVVEQIGDRRVREAHLLQDGGGIARE